MSWITSGENFNREDVGGKAYHLFLLEKWGANVPKFGVVSTSSFFEWKEKGRLDQELIQLIQNDVSKWGGEFFAVRSSMTAEDGEISSYAGVMETFLYVKPDQIPEKIVECFKSAFSERATDYHKKQVGNEGPNLGAAVVIQMMVPSEKSGVAFSRAPLGNSALIYVEAGYGLGEGVVSGLVEVDAYWWDRFGGEVKRKESKKESQVKYSVSTKQVQTEIVSIELSEKSVLISEELSVLTRVVLDLEKYLGRPADVEWSIANDKLYILQVRPITQAFTPLAYYVDTNLSESYPGLTSPFTASFVQKMYTKVFKDAALHLGFTSSRKAFFDPFFDSLIQYFDGHLYYHLNSYYAAIMGLPGGEKNLEAWHRMIGGNLQGYVGKIQVPPFSLLGKLRLTVSMLKLVFMHSTVFGGFCEHAKSSQSDMERGLSESRSSKETLKLMFDVVMNAKDWGLTALNDVLVMNGLKLLSKKIEEMNYPSEAVLSLLKTSEGVESLKPLTELRKICNLLKNKRNFLVDVQSYLDQTPKGFEPETIYHDLESKGYVEECAQLQSFLEIYGDRAFEELKLECMTFKQSPSSFLRLVLWMSHQTDVNKKNSSRPSIQVDRSKIGFLQNRLLDWLISFTEKSIKMREETRLLRGQYYGWVRRALLKAIYQLKQESPDFFKMYSNSSFFGLSFMDYSEYCSGKLNYESLHQKLSLKCKWDESKYSYPEFFCHPYGSPAPAYFVDSDNESTLVPSSSNSAELIGVGAAPGRVQGKALVLIDPRDAMNYPSLNGYILVTRSTDPAWIFIMSQCAGLVSEKGSLLSHTAIIGREMNIPTVVGVPRALSHLQTGDLIEIDGEKGTVTKSVKLN